MMIVERKNTLVISFVDRDVPKPTPFELHEWIYEVFHFEEHELEAIQVNNFTRQVYIKCTEQERVQKAITDTNGESTFLHSNGQRSRVTITTAGLGFRVVKLYHVPVELDAEIIKTKLAQFGTVLSLTMDIWGSVRYKIRNGVRTVKLELTKHIPSYIDIGSGRSFVSYEGQPSTCAFCNSPGHLRNDCPRRRVIPQTPRSADPPTWAQLVNGALPCRRVPEATATVGNGEEATQRQPENAAVDSLPPQDHKENARDNQEDERGAQVVAARPCTLSEETVDVSEVDIGRHNAMDVRPIAEGAPAQGQHGQLPSSPCEEKETSKIVEMETQPVSPTSSNNRDPRLQKKRKDTSNGASASGSKKKEKRAPSPRAENTLEDPPAT